MTIGDVLADARRQAGLSVGQVSQRTCIRETIIRGIERDDYSACGGDFYARGHIRSIARVVGADPDALVREYDATLRAPQPISAAEVFEPTTPIKIRERRRPNWTLALLAVLLAVAGVISYRLVSSQHPATAGDKPPAHTAHYTPPTAAPTPSPTPSPTPRPSATVNPHQVTIKLAAKTGYCWVELTRQSSGQILYEGTLSPGTSKRWVEYHAVYLRLGNPGAVTLIVNGKATKPGVGTTPNTLALGPPASAGTSTG